MRQLGLNWLREGLVAHAAVFECKCMCLLLQDSTESNKSHKWCTMVKVKRRGVKAQFEVQYVQSHKLSSLVALIKGGPDAASSSLQVQKSNHQDMLHQAQ